MIFKDRNGKSNQTNHLKVGQNRYAQMWVDNSERDGKQDRVLEDEGIDNMNYEQRKMDAAILVAVESRYNSTMRLKTKKNMQIRRSRRLSRRLLKVYIEEDD